MSKKRTLTEVEEVLLLRRQVDENGCWLYSRSISPDGYPRIMFQGKVWKVSRLAARLWLDFDLDPTLYVCHKDDCNKLCFNPDHLYIGTPSDNARDRVAPRYGI